MPLQGADDVKKMLAKNKKESNDNIRKVYFHGLTNIIEATPVDEGRARNNWFLTVGAPFSLAGRNADKSGGGSESSAASMPAWVLNKKIYFTNNLPYIGVLEYGGYPSPVKKGTYIKAKGAYEIKSIGGYSKQAPVGWVRRTLVAIKNQLGEL